MSKKEKIFGISGAVFQLFAIIAGFFPFMFKMDENILDPFKGEFIFEKTVQKFNLFFDPTVIKVSAGSPEQPKKGLAFVCAVAFIVFGVAAVALTVLSVIKKQKTKLPLTADVFALVCLLISVAGVANYELTAFTSRYTGAGMPGIIIVLALQVLSLAAFVIPMIKKKKAPAKKKK